MRLTEFESRRVDELAPATLASYKTKAGAAATAADAVGDRKTADKRFSGIVKATKKQFDQDAKGVSEDNLHGGRPDDEVKFFIDSEPAYYAVMDRFGDHIDFRGDDMVAPLRLWGAIQQTAGDAGGAADIAGLEDEPMWVGDELDEQGVAEAGTRAGALNSATQLKKEIEAGQGKRPAHEIDNLRRMMNALMRKYSIKPEELNSAQSSQQRTQPPPPPGGHQGQQTPPPPGGQQQRTQPPPPPGGQQTSAGPGFDKMNQSYGFSKTPNAADPNWANQHMAASNKMMQANQAAFNNMLNNTHSAGSFRNMPNFGPKGVVEGSSYNIDQDDHDEFTPDEIVRIKNSHFPDTLRDNLRAAKKEARPAKHFSSSSDGGDSKLGSPVGSASDNTYEGMAEAEEQGIDNKYRRAAKEMINVYNTNPEIKAKIDANTKPLEAMVYTTGVIKNPDRLTGTTHMNKLMTELESIYYYGREQGVAEADDSKFVGFMNKTMSDKVDAPKADTLAAAPAFYRNAAVSTLDARQGFKNALKFGLKALSRLDSETRQQLAAGSEQEVEEYLTDVAERSGQMGDDTFVEEDLSEVQDYLSDVFHDPSINSWKDVLQQSRGVAEDDDAVAAFLARGGEIQQLKPQRGPKRSGVGFASKHIGSASGRGNTKGKVSGLGANTGKAGKPVVTAEQGIAEDALAGMKRLAGIAPVHTPTTPGQRQYRHMPTAVQPR